MQGITPFLWFEDKAEEAARFYVSIFENSNIGSFARYGEAEAEASGRPRGSVMTVPFQLEGQDFVALNGGPEFKFSPAISFFVGCRSQEEVDELWAKLSEGGAVLMELGAYPFSPRYGWVQDRYGVSWQLNLAPRAQKIAPCLLFVGEQHGKAEQAINFYVSQFDNSSIAYIERYDTNEEEPQGTVKHAGFTVRGHHFIAMDSGKQHAFTFTPAISFMAGCETQEQIDQLWDRLSEGGQEWPCGWLSDRYGISWQVVPSGLGRMLTDPDTESSQRVMRAMLQMRKLDKETLEQAYEPQGAGQRLR